MTRPAETAVAAPVDVEGRVQVGLTLAVGAVAACASWSHVLDLATEHGQGGWLAWAVAACIETGAVSSGLEVRRRRRAGQASGFPLLVLISTTVLQLAVQVAQAEPTPWGVVLAAVPAVTFLLLVKLTVARTHATTEPVVAVSPVRVDVVPAAAAVSRPPAPVLATRTATSTTTSPRPPAVPTAPAGEEDDGIGELLLVGRAVADDLARQGLALNRRNLLAGIRARGRSCSSERASALLRALRAA